MVDRADISKVNELYSESNQITLALDMFAEGGVISAMTISPPLPKPEEPTIIRSPVAISTVGIEYPPQMVEAIKQELAKRQHEIEDELKQLGVS